MPEILTKTPTAPKEVLKHSSLGIAAFILTLIADFFLLLGTIAILAGQSNGVETKQYIIVALYWIFVIPSTFMAVIDVTKQGRKKILPMLAIIFGIGLIITLFIVFVILMLVIRVLL